MSLKNKMTRSGVVVSNKTEKTVVVRVERVFQHALYDRTVKQSKKLMAHDEQNVCQEGDVVAITSCRPLSKNKTFKLVQVLESANK